MLVQAFIVSAQVYVVNRFFITPYLKLKERRDGVTIGADSKRSELTSEVQKLAFRIQENLDNANTEIKKIRELELTKAKKTKEAIVSSAHKEMTDLVNEARKAAFKNYQEEALKTSSLVNQYTQELFSKISKTV